MVNKIGVDDVLGWFKAALDVGAKRSGPLFGAAALQLLVWIVLMLVLGGVLVVAGVSNAGGSPDEAAIRVGMASVIVPVLVVFFLLSMVLTPIFGGGLVQAVHNADQGLPASAMDAFAGFRGDKLRPLAGLAVLAAAGFALNLLGQAVFGGSEFLAGQWAIWDQLARGDFTPPPPPRMPVANFLWGMGIGVVNGILGLLVVPAVQLGGRSAWAAIAEALRALARHPGPLLLAALIGFAAIIGASIVLGVVMVLLALLGILVPWLALPLMFLLMFAWVLVFVVVYYAFARAAWRGISGEPSTPAPVDVVAA
jgi:hypothetical protein